MPRSLRFPLRTPLTLVVLLFIGANSFGGTDTACRVLFVGNSYTYYNSMPQLFKAMAEHEFPERRFETKFVGGGGATLKNHWQVGQALAEIKTGTWDYVVLQEQSSLGSNDLADPKSWKPFYKYARMFAREIRNSGAETVFYMTWSRKNSTEQQTYLTTAYETIAAELGSKIAPVGLVWQSIGDNGTMELYDPDGSHPTVNGSYLAAMTLFATIFEAQPQNMPGRLDGYVILRGGVFAQKISTLSDVREADVREMEEAVWREIH